MSTGLLASCQCVATKNHWTIGGRIRSAMPHNIYALKAWTRIAIPEIKIVGAPAKLCAGPSTLLSTIVPVLEVASAAGANRGVGRTAEGARDCGASFAGRSDTEFMPGEDGRGAGSPPVRMISTTTLFSNVRFASLRWTQVFLLPSKRVAVGAPRAASTVSSGSPIACANIAPGRRTAARKASTRRPRRGIRRRTNPPGKFRFPRAHEFGARDLTVVAPGVVPKRANSTRR